jgi:MFS family permease
VATAVVLASGVALYAMNVYVTSALLPSAVRELGGNSYYAWALTSFLIASVVASMLVNQMLGRFGAARVYGLAYAVFACGSLINAVTPDMAGLVIGRAVQGSGGGLLAGLGYAVIRTALPQRLWTRAAGLVSAMWGIGNLLGPALGGGFAQVGWWRGAFFLLVAASVVLAVVAQRALPNVRGSIVKHRFPLVSVLVLSAAAAAFSISSVLSARTAMITGSVAGALLLVLFLAVDRRAGASVLPRIAYDRRGPLPWIFLTVAGLSAGGMADNFVPLFGQRLAGMAPIVAGFLGAALSMGWTCGQLFSVNLRAHRTRRTAVVIGPAVLTAGLIAYGLLQQQNPSLPVVIGWIVALVSAGTGIGIAFPHMSVAAMSISDDPTEGAKAATGVNTTQLIANTMAAAYAGVLVSFGAPSEVDSARWMAFGLAAVTALSLGATVISRAPRS